MDPSNPLLLPRENGKPADRHAVTRYINKAGAAAGLPHIHPHQLRHTLATQAINRGMSLEAIAAMLGHRSMDMTLRYAKIASRTVADEYFAVTNKVDALYGQTPVLPADAIGPKWPGCAASTTACSATATASGPPSWTAPSSRSARPAPSSRPVSSSGPPCRPSTTTPSPSTKTTAGGYSPHCSPESTRTHHEPARTAPGPTRPLPAPVTGDDSRQVLTNAVDNLARQRTAYWLGDAAVHLHALTSLIAQAQQLLPQAVHDARDQELTWTQIGELLGTTAATASRRYRNKP